MAKLLKLRRGTTSQHSSFTGAEGEVTIDTDKDTAVVHDGSTAAGRPLAREDLNNVASASITGRLASGAIAGAKIAYGAITSAHIAADTVVAADIAANAVGTSEIAADAVTGDQIADNAINSEHYVDASIDNAHLADNAVGTNEISADAVSFDKMQNIPTARLLGRTTSGTGDIETLAAGDARTFLNVENGATADQSNAEIRAAVEAASDSNVFTDADHSKLNGIEASATADQSAAEILTAIKTVDGAGSGLDADTLDGVSSGSFVRSDADDTVSGHTEWQDSKAARFGDDNDMSIFSDGSSNFITANTNTLKFCKSGNNVVLQIEQDGDIWAQGTIYPWSNNTYDLGNSTNRWRNIYTMDLQLSNEGSSNDVDGTWGNYTIQEGEDDLFLLNRRNGKKYKFNLTEIN